MRGAGSRSFRARGYEAGLELRLPAKRTARFGPLAGLDPYRPVAREERIVTEVVSEASGASVLNGIAISFADSVGGRGDRSLTATLAQLAPGEARRREEIRLGFQPPLPVAVYFRVDYGGTATPGEDYEIESRFLEIPAGSETFAFYFVLLNDASGNANEPEETIQMRLTELSRADYLAQSGGTASGQAYYTARRSQTPEGRTVLDLTVRLAARGSPTLEAGSLQLALSPATASPNEDPASDGDPPATVSFTVSLQDEGGSATTHALADLQYELVAFNRSAAYGEDFSFASDDSPETISGGAKVVATLKAGEGSNTHVVTILDDEEAELAESFYLELVTLPPSDPRSRLHR